MYWPLGVPSIFSLPRHDDDDTPSESDTRQNPLLSLSRSNSGNLLATVTATELFIWQSQVSLLPYFCNMSTDIAIAHGSSCFSSSIPNLPPQLRKKYQSCSSWGRQSKIGSNCLHRFRLPNRILHHNVQRGSRCSL